jgi:hypothetical protein
MGLVPGSYFVFSCRLSFGCELLPVCSFAAGFPLVLCLVLALQYTFLMGWAFLFQQLSIRCQANTLMIPLNLTATLERNT